ncbi:MAG: hypothetical protein M3O94_00160, partial [Actinomycetota bacterium]|nr:hypothetical protein [Actinomycetota bacterium]
LEPQPTDIEARQPGELSDSELLTAALGVLATLAAEPPRDAAAVAPRRVTWASVPGASKVARLVRRTVRRRGQS